MALQKNDFIKINFVGKTKNGNVFDSNIKEELEKLKSNSPAKPFIFSIGQGMFLKGIDDFLIGKEVGKHKIELTPEDSFGLRDSKKIQMMPIKVFHEQKVQPVQGVIFNFDGQMAKIMSVNGGRVMVDFNNPMAGKDVTYDLEILEKLESLNEKINAFNDFLFRKELKFEVKDKKLILELDEQLKQVVPLFAPKYKEVFDLDLEVGPLKESKKEPK